MVIKVSFSSAPVSPRVKKNITAVSARLVLPSRSQLHDFEERLLFPGVRDGRAVVETVHGHGLGAEVRAAGEREQAQGKDSQDY
jgi:hypothetical protein